jgi:tetratricopeptide (TPR) repeat protein
MNESNLTAALTFAVDIYFRSAGEGDWRSVLLHTKSELYFARGLYAEALATGQEGWALWNDGCPKFYATSHLLNLFNICLALNDTELARKCLDEWERNDEKKSRVRESTFYQMQSRLARLRGDTTGALDCARRAVQSVEIADWGQTCFDAGCALVRACLVAGDTNARVTRCCASASCATRRAASTATTINR